MGNDDKDLSRLAGILREIVRAWYDRVKAHYVTEEESRQLGVEPEVKIFHEAAIHRIKFARTRELDVTYGLSAIGRQGQLFVESSVNNKSEAFDFDSFVERLKSYYWRTRNEKPWTQPEFDRFTYDDLMPFEPLVGESVALETRKEKADIIRLTFPVNKRWQELLMSHPDVLSDLVENYCLNPLKRIYAESYHGN